ncbi:MAG: DUF421 domain-containing protein [Cyanobacteriota bacterium]|nr:DUF421 domain-containing protein [Cyanobacteriota bacterium]
MFDNWYDIFQTIIVGTFAYIGIIILLRVSGKRTLSKWNSFDFIVTIAIGSILASTLLLKDISLLQGLIAIVVLTLLQLVITWVSIRSKKFQELVKATPTLLLYRGKMRHDVMKKERVTEGEVLGAIRSNGIADIEDVEAVVLETNGTFSVIKESKSGFASALSNVQGYPSQNI